MENQFTIASWAADTFGPISNNYRIAARANEEMAELVRISSAEPDSPKVEVEAADVVITLCRLAEALGCRMDRGGDVPPRHTVRAAACYGNTRMSMLLNALELDDRHEGAHWCLASIYEAMKLVCKLRGVDLWEVVEAKMAVNHARQWKLDGTGAAYHVRDKSVPDAPPTDPATLAYEH